jgi:hypothetical protein
MTWTALAYFGVAVIFAFVGIVVIDWFAELYPDHEPYDDDLRCICHRSFNCPDGCVCHITYACPEHYDPTKD